VSDPGGREPPRSFAAKAGVVVSAFCVFTAGWIAMKSDDWRVIGSVSVLALVAGLVASRLSVDRR
jgi:hypothetical protein